MRILIITHSYFPANEPRAFRWTRISEVLVSQGIDVDVLTMGNCGRFSTVSKKKGVRIIRVIDPIETFKNRSSKSGIKNKSIEGNFFSIGGFIRKLLEFIRWPDYAFLWILPAIKVGNILIKNNNYYAVISVSNPFSSHVVANFLRLSINNIPWICDYGDPFSFEFSYPSNNLSLYRKINFWFEEKIISKSKKISVTNYSVLSRFKEYFDIGSSSFKVIPPFINIIPLNVKKNDFDIYFDNQSFHLVYTGVLYSSIRNPSYLLKVISLINEKNLLPQKVKLHFFGNLGDCKIIFDQYSSSSIDWLFLHGNVTQEVIHSCILKASVLVNLGNKSGHQLPSKIYEYMSTKLPILNFVYSYSDLTIEILNQYNSSCTLLNSCNYIDIDVQKIVDFIKCPTPVNKEYLRFIFNENSISSIAKKYLDFIEN